MEKQMTPEEIINALPGLDYRDLNRIREAAEKMQQAMKADAKARAEAMGMRCQDGNGKKSRKSRSTNIDDEAEAN